MAWGRPTLAEAARFCGRALLVAAFIAVAGFAVAKLSLVFLAIFVAVIFTSLLLPVVEWLHRHGWRRGLAAVVCVLLFALALGGAAAWIVPQAVQEVRSNGPELTQRLDETIRKVSQRLPVGAANLDQLANRTVEAIRNNAQTLATGLLAGAVRVAHALTGGALALVLTFFFLRDRPLIREKFVGLFRKEHRPRVQAAASSSWDTLGGWIRGAAVIALVDAVGIGTGLLIVGVPLALPLALLTFLGAFIPVVGATVTGALAVLVALATGGTTDALIILAVVLAVQQLEGNVLEPFVLGRYVPLHPAIILLVVACGAIIGGIAGAFVAVPVAAAVAAGVKGLGADAEDSETPDRSRDAKRVARPKPVSGRAEDPDLPHQRH